MSIERPNISLEVEKVLSSDIVLHSSAKYTAVIPPNSVEYSINNAYGASSTNVTVNLKYPLDTLIPTKQLFFVDVYHNVQGLLYNSDGSGPWGSGGATTNLFSYYTTAATQTCASPPSVKNVTMVNCPIAHCCTSSEVRIGSRSITNQPNMYYDAASRFLPNWIALRENRLTFTPSTHWDRFVKYDEQTDNSEFSPFGAMFRNNIWCTRSQFISAIYPSSPVGAALGFALPAASANAVAASFNVHTRFYSGVPNSALNYYLDSDEMMIAPQALDILLTFNNLGNMLRFKDASHWIIPGTASGAAGSEMTRISLPSADCINGGSASFASITGNKINNLATTKDAAYFVATGVNVSGKIDIGSSTLTPLSNQNFAFISKIVSQNSAVIAPKLTHRFIPHIETFTLVDNQAVPCAKVGDAGTAKYSSIKPGTADFNGNTVTLSKYPDYLMFYFVHRALQESSSMAAGAFNAATNVYLPFSLKFAINGGPLNYTVLSTLPNISPSEGPETLSGNNALYYPYIVSTDSGDNVSFAEHCGNTMSDVLYANDSINLVSGVRPMNGGIMILKLNKSLIPPNYGLGPQSNVTVLLGPVSGTVLNYNTTPVFASKATALETFGEEYYTLRVCAIYDSILLESWASCEQMGSLATSDTYVAKDVPVSSFAKSTGITGGNAGGFLPMLAAMLPSLLPMVQSAVSEGVGNIASGVNGVITAARRGRGVPAGSARAGADTSAETLMTKRNALKFY